MPVQVVCPGCDFRGSVPDRMAGKRLRCKKCGSYFEAHAVSPLEGFALEVGDQDDWAIQEQPSPAPHPQAASHPIAGPQPGSYRCQFCGSSQWPEDKAKVSAVGWALFALLFIVFCWPLCWVGLLIRDNYKQCPSCGMIS